MQLFNSSKDKKNFLKLILKIILALIAIQILRATFMAVLWFGVPHPPRDISNLSGVQRHELHNCGLDPFTLLQTIPQGFRS